MLNNKPHSRNWNDVKMAIATIAVTGALGLWNQFSKLEDQAVNVTTGQANPSQVVSTQTVQTRVLQVSPTVPFQENAIIIFPTQQPTPTNFIPTVLSTMQPTVSPTALPTALPKKQMKSADVSNNASKQSSGAVTKTGSSK